MQVVADEIEFHSDTRRGILAISSTFRFRLDEGAELTITTRPLVSPLQPRLNARDALELNWTSLKDDLQSILQQFGHVDSSQFEVPTVTESY